MDPGNINNEQNPYDEVEKFFRSPYFNAVETCGHAILDVVLHWTLMSDDGRSGLEIGLLCVAICYFVLSLVLYWFDIPANNLAVIVANQTIKSVSKYINVAKSFGFFKELTSLPVVKEMLQNLETALQQCKQSLTAGNLNATTAVNQAIASTVTVLEPLTSTGMITSSPDPKQPTSVKTALVAGLMATGLLGPVTTSNPLPLGHLSKQSDVNWNEKRLGSGAETNSELHFSAEELKALRGNWEELKGSYPIWRDLEAVFKRKWEHLYRMGQLPQSVPGLYPCDALIQDYRGLYRTCLESMQKFEFSIASKEGKELAVILYDS